MKVSRLLLCLALSGCAAKQVPVNREIVHDALIPVAAPCVNGERPGARTPLNEQFTESAWRALQVQQKAALVGRQALGLMKRAEDLDAVTAACP